MFGFLYPLSTFPHHAHRHLTQRTSRHLRHARRNHRYLKKLWQADQTRALRRRRAYVPFVPVSSAFSFAVSSWTPFVRMFVVISRQSAVIFWVREAIS